MGQKVLKERENTKEGRAQKRDQYERTAITHHALLRPTEALREMSHENMAWKNARSPLQCVMNDLAAPDFEAANPKD